MAGWLTAPIELHSSRAFECGDFTDEQCDYYRERWHFWYEADLVFALPTVAFFMCAIGIFIIANIITQIAGYGRFRGPPIWRRLLAGLRYLSYRSFHVKSFRWTSAPLGVLLLAAVGVVYFFCMDLAPKPYYWPSLDWGSSPPLATRSGWMALACMPFIFATASKANWITLVTGVPHEKLQVFHRWISYAFFLLALLHTFPFIVSNIRNHVMVMELEMSLIFYWTGIVALIFQAWLTFASFGPLRNLGYEFFKAAHFFSVVVFILILFWHCDYTLTSWDYFIATAAVYVPCFVYPWLRTCFEYGLGQKAQLFVEENGFVCVTIPAKFEWVPGQHCFLRFRGFGIHALTSHPFTICSLPSISPTEPSQITFYLRHQGGFTARLYNYAMKQPGVSVPVLVDGPYGGIDPHKFHNSDRLIVIAGGSGAGWILPFIEQFARCRSLIRSQEDHTSEVNTDYKKTAHSHEREVTHNLSPPSSLRVILATRDTPTRVWFHKTVTDILSKYLSLQSPLEIDVQVHLTGEAEQRADSPNILADLEQSNFNPVEKTVSSSDSSESQGFQKDGAKGGEQTGRPRLPSVIQEEAAKVAETGQSLAVFVCGPETMQNDVRNAVARENLKIMGNPRSGGVYLHLEHFSWA